jgi:hypothetical protein
MNLLKFAADNARTQFGTAPQMDHLKNLGQNGFVFYSGIFSGHGATAWEAIKTAFGDEIAKQFTQLSDPVYIWSPEKECSTADIIIHWGEGEIEGTIFKA